MGRQRVVDILCRRDGIAPHEADDRIDDAVRQMEEAKFSPDECEEILADVLGLELDYIFDLL